MVNPEVFRVNYFVGAMLAQGGNLQLDGSKIIFSPTSSIDRAMGAKDVEIRLNDIRSTECSGGLARTFRIITDSKVHKFEGAQAQKFWEILQTKLLSEKTGTSAAAPVPPTTTSQGKATDPLVCHQCAAALQPGFSFCPSCGTRLKTVCQSCNRVIAPSWSACAFCGRHILSKAA